MVAELVIRGRRRGEQKLVEGAGDVSEVYHLAGPEDESDGRIEGLGHVNRLHYWED